MKLEGLLRANASNAEAISGDVPQKNGCACCVTSTAANSRS